MALSLWHLSNAYLEIHWLHTSVCINFGSGSFWVWSLILRLESSRNILYEYEIAVKWSSAMAPPPGKDAEFVMDVLAWLFNVVTSVVIIMVNKQLLSVYKFNFGKWQSTRQLGSHLYHQHLPWFLSSSLVVAFRLSSVCTSLLCYPKPPASFPEYSFNAYKAPKLLHLFDCARGQLRWSIKLHPCFTTEHYNVYAGALYTYWTSHRYCLIPSYLWIYM